MVFADPHLFKIFDYNWISGNPDKSLNDPNSVVLTESMALKYFGNVPAAIGKSINVKNQLDLKVTGVLEDPPDITHLRFKMLIALESVKQIHDNIDRWDLTSMRNLTYVLLPENYTPDHLERQFDTFKKKYLDPEDVQRDFFALQPLKEIHYESKYSSFYYTTSKKTIWIFSIIGFLILVIACINFVNLATAQAIKRSREVGLRKVLGANRVKLISQFMGETILFTLIAVCVSLIFAELSLRVFSQVLLDDVQFELFGSGFIFGFISIIYVIVCLLTGIYPALVLSGYQPIQALRNKITSRGRSTLYLRNSLIVTQFIISQVLIISTIIIAQQMDYFRSKELGFDQDEIISVKVPERESEKLDIIRNTLTEYPEIKNISFSIGAPTAESNMETYFSPEGGDETNSYLVGFKPVDLHYFQTFDLNLLAGRWFSPRAENDTTFRYIANAALAKRIGLVRPEDAVGKYITVSGMKGEIIGVVKDFHMRSLHEEIMPVVLTDLFPEFYGRASIKSHGRNIPETLTRIEQVWQEVFPEYVFEYQFLDEFLAEQYKSDDKTFNIIKVFTLIAILICCLGLLGLISFMVSQKTKEISIRKVLGASISSIILLLSKEFTKWVLLANLIAWPVAWFAMNMWLQNFAYRIEVSWWVFALAGGLALVIALLTVSMQAVKAALANPVESLRYE